MPQDMSAVGNAASASKKATGGSKELTSFSVKKGDNGGVTVSETYESKAPAGRRSGASFPGGGDYKENPFGPTDQLAARVHITGLLAQMTGGGADTESRAENRKEGGIEEPGERPIARPVARPVAPPRPPMRPPVPMPPPSGPGPGY